MQSNLFKKSSMDRISSPEKLHDYIRVSNPSSWMVLAAAMALVIGLLVWGFMGQLDETMTFSGRLHEGSLQCYVEAEASRVLEEGMEVTLTAPGAQEDADVIKGEIIRIADVPLSADEISEDITGDYMLMALGLSSWNIEVTIQPDKELYDNLVYQVNVVTDTQRPIDLVFQ